MTSIGCKRSLVFVHYIYSRTIVNDSKWAEIESICWKSTRQTVHGKIFQLFGFHFFHDILTELAVFYTVAVPLTSLLWTQRAELLSTINMFVYKNRHTTYQLPPGILKKVCFSFNNIFIPRHFSWSSVFIWILKLTMIKRLIAEYFRQTGLVKAIFLLSTYSPKLQIY